MHDAPFWMRKSQCLAACSVGKPAPIEENGGVEEDGGGGFQAFHREARGDVFQWRNRGQAFVKGVEGRHVVHQDRHEASISPAMR